MLVQHFVQYLKWNNIWPTRNLISERYKKYRTSLLGERWGALFGVYDANKITCTQILQVPGRVFVREGTLVKICRKGPKKRQFFLFNDVLVSLMSGNLVSCDLLLVSHDDRFTVVFYQRIAMVTNTSYHYHKCQ